MAKQTQDVELRVVGDPERKNKQDMICSFNQLLTRLVSIVNENILAYTEEYCMQRDAGCVEIYMQHVSATVDKASLLLRAV